MCAALLIVFYCLQLNYTRPGLPKLNPRLLENWKNEVKEKGRINCPNNVRTSLFFSGLAGLSLLEEGESFGAETHQSQVLFGPRTKLAVILRPSFHPSPWGCCHAWLKHVRPLGPPGLGTRPPSPQVPLS